MSFSISIEPEWNVIKKIRDAIDSDDLIAKQNSDFIEATRLVSIELVENALKYSDSQKGSKPVRFSFHINVTDKECIVKVTNPCTDAQKKQFIKRTLDEIKTGDPFELYVARLEQLKDNPDGFSRMGLYRIAYEAEFEMDAEFNEEGVTISARKELEI